MRHFTLLIFVLLASPAWGGGWEDCLTGAAKGTVGTQDVICFDPVDNDLDSDVLWVGHCENNDIIYNSDTTGTDNDTSCAMRQCLGMTTTVGTVTADSNACDIIGGAALTGTAPLDALEGPGRGWIYADCTTNPGTDTPRVMVHCNAP